MKPSTAQISEAVTAMAELIPFFPQGDIAKRIVAIAIGQFVDDEPQLEWLTLRATHAMGDGWKGLNQLRGLFCTCFRPADGIEAECTLPGHTVDEREAAYIRKEAQSTEQRLLSYRHQKQLAAPGEVFDAPPLPEVRDMPGSKPRGRKQQWEELLRAEAELAIAPKKPARSAEENERLVLELERELERSAHAR